MQSQRVYESLGEVQQEQSLSYYSLSASSKESLFVCCIHVTRVNKLTDQY